MAINIVTNRTLTLKTWRRYVAYIHLVEMTVGWEKKCYTIIPLNYIDPRFELIETVHFENYVQSDKPGSNTGLLTYIEGFLGTVYPHECDFVVNLQYLIKEHGFEVLPARCVSRKGKIWSYWRNYFHSYEVKGFPIHEWVIESPYSDEIRFPSYLELTYVGERKGESRYKIKDRFAIQK